MKLKTLKDLRFTEKGDFWNWKDEMSYSKNCKQLVEELKQEAIKWVKAFIKEENPAIFQQMLPPPDFRPVKLFIMEFFNITEEDLK